MIHCGDIATYGVTDMELRHLRYFTAVAEELNFRRAAARLCIAAPPLTVQIHKLEQEMGVKLFGREGRGIRLTEAGRVFLDEAKKTLSQAARGVALARLADGGEIGHLTIGHNVPAGFLVFPNVVPAFRKTRPAVQLTFRALNMPQQIEGLRREELDLGVVWLPVPTAEFDIEELVQESLFAVVPASHPLAKQSQVGFKDLSGEPLIMPSRDLHPDTYYEIQQRFSRERATMQVAYELESSLSMINFVAMGLGCTLLPNYARNIRQSGVVFRPLKSPPFQKTLAVIKLKRRPGLADTFVKFAVDRLRQRQGNDVRRSSIPE
jgi:DNA-binding transcriptional LysR family regulator